MDIEKRVVFYCSASYDIDSRYNQAAREVVRAACSLGYTVVSGGAIKGTMGAIGDEVARCGGRHIGVLPRFMEQYKFPGLSEIIWTDTMDERKELLREGTCAVIALPGGIGTLDELIGTLTLAKLKKYSGKIYALNLDGFYNPLKSLLDHYVATGMLDAPSKELMEFPDTIEELVGHLN